MVEVTVEEFEKNFDTYMDRIENGEEFIIRQPDGRGVVAVPADKLEQATNETHAMVTDEWYNMYTDHSEGS
jgi:antitoxin (DNA-binding transcriptional repressor) of toxin-antitoxin stability system